jgi:hypothetical protein
MAEVNQLATCFPTRSAGPGSIAVRADIEYFSLFGRPRADRFSVPTLSQCLDAQSRPFDDHSLSA